MKKLKQNPVVQNEQIEMNKQDVNAELSNKLDKVSEFKAVVHPFTAVCQNGKFYVARYGFLMDKQGNSSTSPHEYRSFQAAVNAANFLTRRETK